MFKSKYIIIFLTVFFSVLFFAKASLAATLTVGDGQQYSTIQAAVNAASCGDNIYIYAGTYNEQVDIDNKQCTLATKVTITPYGADNVTINAPSANRAIYIHGTSRYWVIDGKNQMTLNGASDADGVIRIDYWGGAVVGVQIKNNTINANNPQRAGIILSATDDSLIEGNSFTGAFYRGVEGSNAGTAPSVGNWRLVIRKNICSNPGYACFEASGTSYWLIEKNYLYADTSGLQHLIVHRGGSNWKIQNNVFEVRSGGALLAIAVLRDDTGSSGYNISNEVYINNTFAITGSSVSNSYGVIFLAWGPVVDSRFQNNLFIGDWGTANGIFQFGTGGSGSNDIANNNWKTASDANSPWGTPSGWAFLNNTTGATSYQASGNKPSPYFDLVASYDGSSVNNPPADDFDGNSRGAVPDVGAFEYQGVADTSPPAAPSGVSIS